MIVKFRGTRTFPRKGEYIYSMYIPSELQDYRTWDDVTYEDLFKKRIKGTQAICIWYSKSKEKGFVLGGFRGIDNDFARYINQASGAMLVFGPDRPPIEYLANLYRIAQDNNSIGIQSILDKKFENKQPKYNLIKNENASQYILGQMRLHDTIILQGPPGTGKTRLISEICSHLCMQGHSVLITALTNRALIEIAEKDSMKALLDAGQIMKSNMTVDEQHELPNLRNLKEILPIHGCAVLATFYITSGFAAQQTYDGAFDFVILDEASQALLPMFAAAKRMGIHNLWVGDTAQLSPVVALNENRVRSNKFEPLINGLETISTAFSYPVYQLTKAFRFGQRAAEYTGLFYNNTLRSAVNNPVKPYPSLEKILSDNGGPTLILTDMPPSDPAPQFALDLTTYIVGCLLMDNKDVKIAVLTCLRKTTRMLQQAISVRLGLANEVIIETVARVQGLTSDISIFFIPNTSLIRSLENHLFNVATSRAKEHTIIIADKNVFKFPLMPKIVRSYLTRLLNNT